MKVLYFALGGRGGSDKALVDLLSVLGKDYDVEPLVVCGRKEIIPSLGKAGINYVYYDFTWSIYPPKASLKDKILYIPRILKSEVKRHKDEDYLVRVLRKFNPDIIHTNVGVINIGYRLSKKTGVPNVWHIREYQDLDHGMSYIGGRKRFISDLNKNKYNIGITHGIYNYFQMSFPSVQIYDGVRDLRDKVDTDTPENYFIFAGFLFAGKGLDELLEAYKTYTTNGGKNLLYILGSVDESKPYHKHVTQFVKDNNLEGVRLLGFRNDVDELMSKSSAVIVPSRFEAFGRVACEAMFNKTLVIGKDTAGTKEQFDNVDTRYGKAISLRYRNIDELVEQMFNVQNMNQDTRRSIIETSFDTVNSLYTNEVSAEKVYEYYCKILNGKTNE